MHMVGEGDERMRAVRKVLLAVLLIGLTGESFASTKSVRAVQLDLARQMETVSFVKNFVRKVSACGYNTLVLYLEGRVATPSFSLGEGESYSLDEMREIVSFAADCGMDVVPVVSVFGHAEHFFRDARLRCFAEERDGVCRWPVKGNRTFCLNQPAARLFLEQYVADLVTVFPGKNIHLGLDESFQFGFCKTCRGRREEIGFGSLFSEYVRWAEGLARRLGKQMWMWDDMYEFFPDQIANVPKDVVLCHWIYDDDVTEWGHRGHFLNRVRVDWLAEYENLGLSAIPVGAACVDNLRTLADYAKRYRTLGTYVSQWELSDSFYGPSMPILIGVDRAFPSLSKAERKAVMALVSTWSYFRSNGGIALSRARWNGRIAADATANESEPSAIRLALAVLKDARSRPGTGNVPADPLSEEALLDDLVTHFEQLLFRYELEDASVVLATPRRTISESRTAKKKLQALMPEMKRVLCRKETQERVWRPNMRPNNFTAPMRDNLDYAEKLLAVSDIAADDEWILGLSLSLPDFHGKPIWNVSGLFSNEWRKIASGCWKPARGNWANFEKKIAFRSNEAPRMLRFEERGYGDAMLLYASVWNKSRRLVPKAVVQTDGPVIAAKNILRDDWQPVRMGLSDRAMTFLNPNRAEVCAVLECSLAER